MKQVVRALLLLHGGSLLLGSACTFGRPIVDEQSRYYPSDGVISCTGTRCADLPAYELALPDPLDDSPCAQELPRGDLEAAAQAGPFITGQRFEVAYEDPRELSLGTVDLRDSCVVLTGPVRLTFGAGSTLSHVTVLLGPKSADADARSKPSDRSTPNLYLGHAQLDRVSLEALEEREPSGAAQLEFSSCVQCETRIDSLNVTQSQIQTSRLGADALTIVGGSFDSVELSFAYGLLAGVVANDLRTTACNTLSLVGATIAGRASRIGPCDCGSAEASVLSDAGARRVATAADASAPRDGAPADAELPDAGALDAEASAFDAGSTDAAAWDGQVTDANSVDAELPDAGARDAAEQDARQANPSCNGATLSQTTLLGGMVDGKVRAENSSFRSVLFARHAPTSLDMWSTNIELSVACHHPIDIRLDKTSGIGCTSCDAEGTAEACTLDRAPQLVVNKCESFSGRLPACEPPLPVRMTPAIPMKPKLGM